MSILNLSQYFRERNIQLGLIFFVIATFVAYLTTFNFLPGFSLHADMQFLIGVIIGEIYALRNRTPDQTILKCGLIVGIFGGVFSAFVISLWSTLIYGWNFFDFSIYFVYVLITGIIIGLLIGAIISSYFMYKEMKGDNKEDEKYIDDDFYKDLIEDK